MKFFGEEYGISGSKKYYFFGVPYLYKKRSRLYVRTYFLGIRTSKRKL